MLEKHGKIIGVFEIKSTDTVTSAHLSGFRAFREEHPQVPCTVISRVENAYEIDKVRVLPWQKYLEDLPKLI